jgi:hypothetical protein
MRHILGVGFVALAFTTAVAGQDSAATRSTTANPDQAKAVVLSGCLAGGPSSYTLSNVAPTRVAHEKPDFPIGTSGGSTSYSLTARDGVNLADVVGKKVEIRGVLQPPIPASITKAESGAPKVKQDDSPEASGDRSAAVAAVVYPKVAVTSVRLLSATCQ